MSKQFSFVELTADNCVFVSGYVSGSPCDTDDMESNDIYIDLIEEYSDIETVEVNGQTFLFGEGESEPADESDLEIISADINFLKRDDVELLCSICFTARNNDFEQEYEKVLEL